MWHDHPFSQRNKTTERAVGVGVGGDREEQGRAGKGGRVGGQDLKKGSRQYIGGLYKIVGVGPLYQLCRYVIHVDFLRFPFYRGFFEN